VIVSETDNIHTKRIITVLGEVSIKPGPREVPAKEMLIIKSLRS